MKVSELIPKINAHSYIRVVDITEDDVFCLLAFVAMRDEIYYGYEVIKINPVSENEICIVVKRGYKHEIR